MCGDAFDFAATAAAAVAMTFARTEPNCTMAAFQERLWRFDITRQDRLDRACEAVARQPGGTNASLPMLDALKRGLLVDAFVIVTDDETWAGDQHPAQALERYRRLTGIAARLVVIAMSAARTSTVDANDAFQLEVAGFDRSVPELVSDFIRGRFP